MKASICLMVLVLLVSASALPKQTSKTANARPSYIGCVNSAECGVGNCCVLGMGRYSIPTCQSVQELNGVCRPKGHESFNTSVGYPDGAFVTLTNVYRNFCPCAPTLSCNMKGSCQDTADSANDIFNTVIV